VAAGQNPRRAAAGGDHGPLGAAAACEWEKADRALFDRLACVGESARALPAVASAGKSPTVARAPAEGRVDEMCRRLRHVPAVAGGAHAPSLARKCHDELLRAPRAEIAGESEAEQPAREIPAELLFDVARDWVLACRAICEPAFEALRHDSVERRLLGAAALESGGTPRGRRADAKTAAPETDKKWRPWGNPGRGRVRGRTYTTPGKARCTAGPGRGRSATEPLCRLPPRGGAAASLHPPPMAGRNPRNRFAVLDAADETRAQPQWRHRPSDHRVLSSRCSCPSTLASR